MQPDDQTPEGVIADGGAAVVTPQTAPAVTNGDPLDAIQDEGVRAEMKRLRAIDARHKDKGGLAAVAKEAPATDAVSKNDLAKFVTNQAKGMVSQEIRDNWDSLMAIPLGGYDQLDAHSIAQNMANRLVLFKQGQTDTPANPAAALQTTTATGTGQAPATAAKTEIKLPNFHKPVQPGDWYAKS